MLKEASMAGVNISVPDLEVDFDAPIWLNKSEYKKIKKKTIDRVAESREFFEEDILHESVRRQKNPDNQTDGLFKPVCSIENAKTYPF